MYEWNYKFASSWNVTFMQSMHDAVQSRGQYKEGAENMTLALNCFGSGFTAYTEYKNDK